MRRGGVAVLMEAARIANAATSRPAEPSEVLFFVIRPSPVVTLGVANLVLRLAGVGPVAGTTAVGMHRLGLQGDAASLRAPHHFAGCHALGTRDNERSPFAEGVLAARPAHRREHDALGRAAL